ncbi:hypothetical protein BX666DRAFT_1636583 [Dichotomocladium elegans]|nr:hypothetical protein BX666DRAFT_1636583 [Dichotomocladium elegans]
MIGALIQILSPLFFLLSSTVAMPYYALTTQIPIIKQGVSPIQTFLYAYIFARNQIGTPPIDTSQLRLSSIIDVPHYHQHKSPFCCYLYYQHYYDSCCTNLGIYITIWNSTQQPDVAHQYHPVRNIIKEFLLLFELLPKMRHRYIPIFSRRLLSIICRKTAESRVSYPGWWPLQLIPLHSHYCPL